MSIASSINLNTKCPSIQFSLQTETICIWLSHDNLKHYLKHKEKRQDNQLYTLQTVPKPQIQKTYNT